MMLMYKALIMLFFIPACTTTEKNTVRLNTPESNHGETLFLSYCGACHQYDGQGVGKAPPLDGTQWVTGPEERLIKIVLHGLRGPMEIQNVQYNAEMPGFGNTLSDNEISALLTYVRKRFGHQNNSSAISPETVRRVRNENRDRTEYWRVEELPE